MRPFLRNVLSYVELLLIPGISVILPWWLSIRLYRGLAYLPFLYRSTTEQCLTGATQLSLLGEDSVRWRRDCRVGQMVDLADAFLVLCRGKRFMSRYISENISGQLQEQQIIFVPHFGAGMFVYKLLQEKGVNVTLIGNDFPRNYTAQGLVSRLRLHALTRCGTTTIWNDNMMGIRDVLRQQQTLLILPDVPRSYGWRAYEVATEIGELNIAARYFDLAAKRKIPVMTAVLDVDVNNGQRQFTAIAHGEGLGADENAERFANQVAVSIKEKSYLWRMLQVGEQVLKVSGTQRKTVKN